MTEALIKCDSLNGEVVGYDRVLANGVDGGRFSLFYLGEGDSLPQTWSMVFHAGERVRQERCEDTLLKVLGTTLGRLKGWQFRLARKRQDRTLHGIGNLFEDRWFDVLRLSSDMQICPFYVEVPVIQGCLSAFESVNMRIADRDITDDLDSGLVCDLHFQSKERGSMDYRVRFNAENVVLLPEVMRRIKTLAGVLSWDSLKGRNVRVRRDEAAGELIIGHLIQNHWVRMSDLFKEHSTTAQG